jgi:hypothetical protein
MDFALCGNNQYGSRCAVHLCPDERPIHLGEEERLMSYKDGLQKRKRARKAADAEGDAQTQVTRGRMTVRAKELVQHLKEHRAHDVGAIIRLDGTRILITHGNSPIAVRIDVGADNYGVVTEAPTARHVPAPVPIPSSIKTLASWNEIDAYLLEFLKRVGAS